LSLTKINKHGDNTNTNRTVYQGEFLKERYVFLTRKFQDFLRKFRDNQEIPGLNPENIIYTAPF